MCGFTCLISDHPAEEAAAITRRMTEAIVHRGPDDGGLEQHGRVSMGFRRLSILDLSPAGHQPMLSPDGVLAIVFNGEIYNFIELRDELRARGHVFRSTGDTEVLLHAYMEWGPACVERLNGMWAFAIHDRRDGTVFGARDRWGIKPLFVHSQGRTTIVASEIKCILASGLYTARLDRSAAAAFLYENELDEGVSTFFQGIGQIPPGHAFRISRDGTLSQSRYWSLSAIAEQGNPADPAAHFAELFEDSVRMHMRSDVPVGVNLSGGLDSTSIICASARVRAEQGAAGKLCSFSYLPQEFNERGYVNDTLAQTGAEPIELHTSAHRLWDDLRTVLRFQDEPVHSLTAVVGYQLMGLASDHGIKVILNGQGADETIGGYPNYFRDAWYSLLRSGQLGRAWQQVAAYADGHGQNGRQLFTGLLRHVVQSQFGAIGAYRKLQARRRLERHGGEAWIDPSLLRDLRPMPDAAPASDLRSTLIRSVETSPLPIYLRVEDRNSMAHSIEVRLPFLDVRLVSMLFTLPPLWKLNGPWNKFVLREGMRGRIPESVRARMDKMGFPTPAAQWFRGELRGALQDVLGQLPDGDGSVIRKREVMSLLERHGRGEDHTGRLFNAAQFAIWGGQHGFL
jgi:asparagine synthase (glutamine-hydrolysing)